MKSSHLSKKSLRAATVVSFMLAAVLIGALLANLAGTTGGQPHPASPTPQNPSQGMNFLADQFFVFFTPLVVAFLLYITFLMNTLVKSLSKTVTCSHSNPDCGYNRKYFGG